MPSRMEKYYKPSDVKTRTNKNQELYRTIYDEVEYSNVEGISVIEKNEKIDINKIYELINGKKEEKPRRYPMKTEVEKIDIEENKNYDIVDVLNKAKTERPEKSRDFSNTQYNILKNINLNEDVKIPDTIDADLKNMIDAISNNSKEYTSDLLDDLKTLHNNNLKDVIKEQDDDYLNKNIIDYDKSFYTSSLGFSDDDFEDLKDIKDEIKKNSIIVKILLFIFLVAILTGIMVLVYNLIGK